MEHPVVTTKCGFLKGSKVTGVDGNEYFSFSGIPYAVPPISDLRFRDPQPVGPWTGVRDAMQEGPKSLQIDFITNQMTGSEDCLYLNIATTSLTGKRPVMFWVHGGGFQSGSAGREMYSPDYLIKSGEIVFVSINYRLNFFGFLNMEVEDCAGNQGLKDQLAALKWVKENIEHFGGDPSNVTIFGESAGGAAVHALCISPLAKGLFHRAIAQSGTMLNPWAYRRSNKEFALEVSKALGEDATDPRAVVDFLRKIPESELFKMQDKMFPTRITVSRMIFGPSLDSKSRQPFFSEDVIKCEKPVEVPFLFGYNSHEAIMFQDTSSEYIEKTNANFPHTLAKNLFVDISKVSEMAKEVRTYYFGDRSITDQELHQLVQLKSDTMFGNGIQYVSDIQETYSTPVYMYRFSFLSSVSLMKIMSSISGQSISVQGASHTDELSLLFFMEQFGDLFKLKENSKDRLVMERLTRMWIDFAKTGNPTPKIDDLITVKWPPFMKGKKNYLEINDELAVGVAPGKKSWQFWKPLYQELFSKL